MKMILIVDDIEENLYLLRVLLEGHGYKVIQARNGSEAIAHSLAILPDMIISDILMPEMDGFTFCRMLKRDDRLKQIPFVFYTATYTDPKDEKLALDMGADAFIVKPTEPEEFLRQVEAILMDVQKEGFISKNKSAVGEVVVLKEYNEALIRKLEHKMLGLEQTNKALETEIEARKKAEDDIFAALLEKDVLLKEIHHRVKNNMQVISSMIGLHLNDTIKGMTHDEIITTARDLQIRIRSMALVHEMLYKSESLSKIDIGEYIHNLAAYLFEVFTINKEQITIAIDTAGEFITIITAIPLGQIINELLTNALKFAFPAGRKGNIAIKLTTSANGMYLLSFQDNGNGLPDGFSLDSQQSFGMRLISLLTLQLEGAINYCNDNGASFEILFKKE